MIGHEGGGGRCQNAQKQFIINTYQELILYKPVGKYCFTMACIRALVMIEYPVINRLIFPNKTYIVGTQKNHHNKTVILSIKL